MNKKLLQTLSLIGLSIGFMGEASFAVCNKDNASSECCKYCTSQNKDMSDYCKNEYKGEEIRMDICNKMNSRILTYCQQECN